MRSYLIKSHKGTPIALWVALLFCVFCLSNTGHADEMRDAINKFQACDALKHEGETQACYDKVNNEIDAIKNKEKLEYEKQFTACGSNENQAEMNACHNAMLKTAEVKLDGLYSQLEQKLEDKSRLKKARKSWLAYRKAECEFESHGFVGGSIYPTTLSLCYERLTQQQIENIESQVYCVEGDITCGAD